MREQADVEGAYLRLPANRSVMALTSMNVKTRTALAALTLHVGLFEFRIVRLWPGQNRTLMNSVDGMQPWQIEIR